jgi:putative oxidoreductase
MLKTLEPRALSLLRIMAGFTFSLHGLQKLFGLFGGMGGGGVAATFPSLLWTAGFLEAVGGFLILLGLLTRPVAFILCGEMAVAYFTAHAPKSFWPIVSGGEPAFL